MISTLVTFSVKDSQQKFIKSVISRDASVNFIQDIKEEEIPAALKDADIIFAWNPPKELNSFDLTSLQNIKFMQVLSAGYDHIDFSRYPQSCQIASNKGAYADPMAEHIMAMVLALAKRLFVNHAKLSAGEFNQQQTNISIRSSAFGILGYGGIGKAAAKLIRPFGSEIYAINSTGMTSDMVDFIGTLDDLSFILGKCDILIISLPLIKKTENLIGRVELEMMKPEAILINAARAQIINEEALYNHLKAHPGFSAGIDAWWVEPFSEGGFRMDYPFTSLANVIGSPHNSALVPGSLMEGIRKAVENINLFIEGKQPLHIVNNS